MFSNGTIDIFQNTLQLTISGNWLITMGEALLMFTFYRWCTTWESNSQVLESVSSGGEVRTEPRDLTQNWPLRPWESSIASEMVTAVTIIDTNKKPQLGGWRNGWLSGGEYWLLLQRTVVWFSVPPWQLTTNCDLTPFSGIYWHQVHKWYIDIHVSKMPIHVNKIKTITAT